MRVFRPGHLNPRTTRPILLRLADEMRAQRVCLLDLADRHGALHDNTLSRWMVGHTTPSIADLADVFQLLDCRLRIVRCGPRRIAPVPTHRPVLVPTRVHPLVREFFIRTNRLRVTAKALAAHGGPATSVVASWKRRSTPNLDAFERALAPLGLGLGAAPIDDDLDDDAPAPALSAYRAGLAA